MLSPPKITLKNPFIYFLINAGFKYSRGQGILKRKLPENTGKILVTIFLAYDPKSLEWMASPVNWKNVNNWHWVERDCTNWAHEYLKEKLSQIKAAVATTTTTINSKPFQITAVKSVEGDVSVNQRKGRGKQLFDLEIKFEWKLGDESGEGKIVDFTADTNFDSLELKISKAGEGSMEEIAKILWECLEKFQKDLFKTHVEPLLISVTSPQGQDSTASTVIDSKSVQNSNLKTKTFKTESEEGSKKDSDSLEDEINFNCSPQDIYRVLTDHSLIIGWSRSGPSSVPQIIIPGAPFNLSNPTSSVRGRFTNLSKPGLIEMDWWTSAWSDGGGGVEKESKVRLVIENVESGGCRVVLTQQGIPSGFTEITKAIWHRFYWNPIKLTFGFGSIL